MAGWLGCALACTEMTKTKKIGILRAVHIVELSWASIVIIFSFKNKSLHLAGRALPWTSHGSMENQKFQVAQINVLTADLKSAWKTVYWKCFLSPTNSFRRWLWSSLFVLVCLSVCVCVKPSHIFWSRLQKFMKLYQCYFYVNGSLCTNFQKNS